LSHINAGINKCLEIIKVIKNTGLKKFHARCKKEMCTFMHSYGKNKHIIHEVSDISNDYILYSNITLVMPG
jgi:hypothetical protein